MTSNGDTLSVKSVPSVSEVSAPPCSEDSLPNGLVHDAPSQSSNGVSPMDVLLNKLDTRFDSQLKIAMDNQSATLNTSFDGITQSLTNLNKQMEAQEAHQREHAEAIVELQGRSHVPPSGDSSLPSKSSGKVIDAWRRTSKTRDTGACVWAVVGIGDEVRFVKAQVVHTVEHNMGGKITQGAQVRELNDEGKAIGENMLVPNENMFDKRSCSCVAACDRRQKDAHAVWRLMSVYNTQLSTGAIERVVWVCGHGLNGYSSSTSKTDQHETTFSLRVSTCERRPVDQWQPVIAHKTLRHSCAHGVMLDHSCETYPS